MTESQIRVVRRRASRAMEAESDPHVRHHLMNELYIEPCTRVLRDRVFDFVVAILKRRHERQWRRLR
jgi:hypothetical protein